jgi:hypothetical protein
MKADTMSPSCRVLGRVSVQTLPGFPVDLTVFSRPIAASITLVQS